MISDWRNFETWREAGSPTAADAAERIVAERLSDYAPPAVRARAARGARSLCRPPQGGGRRADRLLNAIGAAATDAPNPPARMPRSPGLLRLRRRRWPLGRRLRRNPGARRGRRSGVRSAAHRSIPAPISSRCRRPGRSRIASASGSVLRVSAICIRRGARRAAQRRVSAAGRRRLDRLGASWRRRRRDDERRRRADRAGPRPTDPRASSCGRLGRHGDRGDPRQPDRREPDALGGRVHRCARARCAPASPMTARRTARRGTARSAPASVVQRPLLLAGPDRAWNRHRRLDRRRDGGLAVVDPAPARRGAELAAIAGLGAAFFSACQATLRFNADFIRLRFSDQRIIVGSVRRRRGRVRDRRRRGRLRG